MTDRLLLDTHIALWFESGSERLLPATCELLDRCWRSGGTIYLSAISVWKSLCPWGAQRVKFHIPVEVWADRFVARPGIETAPLGHRAAARAYRLHDLGHRDPADRLLIATAIDLGCPLVTYDDRIRRFAESHGRQYGFSAMT